MPGFGDSAFIILLALLLFGPKKLPVLARQLGKLMADFRRASNEFRTQMEEELRVSEQADRQKQIAAIEASAPRQSHTPPEPPTFASTEASNPVDLPPEIFVSSTEEIVVPPVIPEHSIAPGTAASPTTSQPLPVATEGDLAIMPPATGLPVAHRRPSEPVAQENMKLVSEPLNEAATEIVHHG